MATADSFKTIDYQSAKPQKNLQKSPDLSSRPGPHWCLEQASRIAGCYRRDEAHDPETFCAALAIVLGDYPVSIVEYAVDPRTGIVAAFPMGLPNVGQIREFLEGVQSRKARIERYAILPRTASKPLAAPERGPGQFSYAEFLEYAKQHGLKSRPIGRFE